MTDDNYRKFVQTIIDNIKKNGFPEKRVAFPIEQLYEAAHNKGINFNKVLETLDEIQIAHEKTPEKIIFHPKDRIEEAPEEEQPANPFAGMNPGMFANLDPSMLKNMDMTNLMGAASSIMQNMSPDQLESVKNMVENMSDEEREAMMEQAKKLGLL